MGSGTGAHLVLTKVAPRVKEKKKQPSLDGLKRMGEGGTKKKKWLEK